MIDVDFAAVLAHLLVGRVPAHPTMRDFDDAQTRAITADPHTRAGVAQIWFAEAVRWRRHPARATAPLDVEEINALTAARAERMRLVSARLAR